MDTGQWSLATVTDLKASTTWINDTGTADTNGSTAVSISEAFRRINDMVKACTLGLMARDTKEPLPRVYGMVSERIPFETALSTRAIGKCIPHAIKCNSSSVQRINFFEFHRQRGKYHGQGECRWVGSASSLLSSGYLAMVDRSSS